MSTTFIATLKVKPGCEAEFERLQQELSELTHQTEPGTIVYDVVRSRADPSVYVVYSRFRDDAAFELHQGTDFHARLVPPILATLAADMQLEFYDWKS
jgi:quinol monooxygenase YgiN